MSVNLSWIEIIPLLDSDFDPLRTPDASHVEATATVIRIITMVKSQKAAIIYQNQSWLTLEADHSGLFPLYSRRHRQWFFSIIYMICKSFKNKNVTFHHKAIRTLIVEWCSCFQTCPIVLLLSTWLHIIPNHFYWLSFTFPIALNQ